MAINPIPKGFHTVTPYIIVKDAVAALAFYTRAFDAEEVGRLAMPDGTIMHGEFKVGDSHVMFAEENAEVGMLGPDALGGSSVSVCLYVDHADATFAQAIAAGAKELRPMQDQFWGDRAGTVIDPFGHSWTILSQIEELSWDQVQQRFESMYVTPS